VSPVSTRRSTTGGASSQRKKTAKDLSAYRDEALDLDAVGIQWDREQHNSDAAKPAPHQSATDEHTAAMVGALQDALAVAERLKQEAVSGEVKAVAKLMATETELTAVLQQAENVRAVASSVKFAAEAEANEVRAAAEVDIARAHEDSRRAFVRLPLKRYTVLKRATPDSPSTAHVIYKHNIPYPTLAFNTICSTLCLTPPSSQENEDSSVHPPEPAPPRKARAQEDETRSNHGPQHRDRQRS